MRLLISNIGLLGFAISVMASYLHLRRRARWASPAIIVGGLIALISNGSYFVWSLRQVGAVETFHHSFESTLLLASLIGLMALCTHISAALRGLDGFLFIGAFLVQIGAIVVSSRTGNDVSYRPWFISHSLAFQISAACFIASGAAGVAYLIMNGLLRKKRASMLVGAVAPLESLERFGRWTLIVGFPLFTFGILTGICEMVRTTSPTAWLKDPLILGSFITWGVFGLMIALIWLKPRIRGRRAATLATCGMALIALMFLVIEFVSPLHK